MTGLPASQALPAVVLMYHALRTGDVPPGQDPHYTLDAAVFERQMRLVAEGPGGDSAARMLDGATGGRVAITFDDGHISNYTVAFPVLQRLGLAADFFVNPANVGRPGYAGWPELREMARAGMSIQSHGYDHVYLTRMNGLRLRQTLLAAREEIEQRIGQPATLLAPPGGRMPPKLVDIARECGYTHVLSSQPGVWRIGGNARRPIPRMAMTAGISDDTFARWIARNAIAIGRERLRYGVLAAAKRVLGDDGYERVRARALGLLRGAT